MVSDPSMARRRRRRLSPSEKYEIYVGLLTGQFTQRGAADRHGVDRSTVVHIVRTAEQTSHGEIVSSGGGVGGVV